MSNIWLPPMRSAWGSISMSIMSPSRRIASSTATSSAISIPAKWRRSPAAPAAMCAMERLVSPSRVEPFDKELVHRIESHQFDPVRVLQWRSKAVDFASIAALKKSLEVAPTVHGLTRALPAIDQQALEYLSRYPEVAGMATTPERVEKLWEACALPDYRELPLLNMPI